MTLLELSTTQCNVSRFSFGLPRYAAFRTPGFDPENASREMARINFDDALSQVSSFTDKSLRSLTTLVLADFCLQRYEQKERLEKAKKKTKT